MRIVIVCKTERSQKGLRGAERRSIRACLSRMSVPWNSPTATLKMSYEGFTPVVASHYGNSQKPHKKTWLLTQAQAQLGV